MKLLHDWSNFDLPKLMTVEVAEHIFLMPASCLSLTNTRQDQHANKLLITARNLRTPAFAEVNKRVFFIAGVPCLLSPIPLLFSFLRIPYRFRRLRRLEFFRYFGRTSHPSSGDLMKNRKVVTNLFKYRRVAVGNLIQR